MKILNLQDCHGNKNWIDEFEKDIALVCETGRSEKIDAICIAGDWLDKQMKADDSDCWDRFLQAGENLQSVAQVFFIRGTVSHDFPGCYASFIKLGWKEVNIGKSHIVGDTLIMGLPEINSAFIHEKFPEINKQEGIEKQYDLVNQIIDDYYVPLSKSHKGPVHFMMHGHISGAKFKSDQAPRTTEFMWDESMLSKIGADYIQAGHIHYPQKYYGGSMHLTWGDTGFIPGFNISSYGDDAVSAERFYFDKLERQKIVISDISELYNLGDKIRPSVNLHLEIKCDKAFADQFDCKAETEKLIINHPIGELSKITTTIQHEEHTRIDLEEYEKASSLEDLALIYNPDFSKSIIQKINISETATASETQSIIPRTFEFLDMELIGSIINYENGIERIFVDYSYFKLGANLFIGANGKGKSFINGLIHPFSEHLPDGSNLKDLFVAKNSSMVRRFKIIETDEIITQKVLIDPTLSSPTAKFYMDINGQNVAAENGNVKPFDEKVSEIFGSVKMFMATVLKAQKENLKMPSLENAKEADLRQIFTELSGIDRTPIKNFANSEVKKLKSNIALDNREVEVLQSVNESAEEIETAIEDSKNLITDKEISLSNSKSVLEEKKTELSGYEKIVLENESINNQISTLNIETNNLSSESALYDHELRNITHSLKNIDVTRSELENLNRVKDQHNNAATAYFEAQGAFNKKVSDWQKDKDLEDGKLKKIAEDAEKLKSQVKAIEATMDEDKNVINGCESENRILGKPCEKCGEIPSKNADEKIESNKSLRIRLNESIFEDTEKIIKLNSDLQTLRDDYKIIQDSIFPYPETPNSLVDLKSAMDSFNPEPSKISELETIINGLKSSETRKTELESSINQKNSRITEISEQIETLKSQIKPVNKIAYEALKIEISGIEQAISDNTGEIGRLTAEIEALTKQLQKNIEREEKIKLLTDSLSKQQTDLTEWEIVETAFSPKGIPAMELSLIAPAINQKANDFLSMNSNRFNVDIVTQDLDSKNNIAEKFKILIHDSKAADVKNLPNCSPGQLSWLTSALQEAISYIRSKKSGRTYLWSIMDEADGALDTEAMSDYYEMMDRAMDGKRKLISVSHSPIAKGIGLNTVNVEDFFMGGE